MFNFFIFILILSSSAFGTTLGPNFTFERLKPKLLFLDTSKENLHLDDLIANPNFSKTKPKSGIYENALYAKLPNLINKTGKSTLVFDYKWGISNLEISCVDHDSGELLWIKRIGYMENPDSLTPHSSTLTKIDIPLEKAVDLYFKFNHDDALNFELYLNSEAEATRTDRRDQLGFGLYFGIILAMFFFNLFLFLSLKDKKYLIYLGILIFGDILAISIMYGLASEYIFTPATIGKYNLADLSFAVTSFLNVLFCYSMLNLTKTSKTRQIFLGYLFFCGFLATMTLAPRYSQITRIVNFNIVISSAFIWLSCLIMSIKGNVGARYLLSAWSIKDLSIIIGMLGLHGFIEENVMTRYCILFGTGIEGMLLAFALTMRIRKMEKDRIKKEAILATTQHLAHDIRRPFSLLTCLMQLIEKEVGKTTLLRTYRPVIIGAMQGVEMTISRLLSLRLEGDPDGFSSIKESINAALLDVFGPTTEDNKISINISLQHTSMINIPKFDCQRMFSNLVDNAKAATGQNGNLWITTTQKGNFVRCVIGNTGNAISDRDKEKIFEPYFTKGKSGGSGLGLPIVKEIIRINNGSIELKSNEKSTEFILHLNAAASRENSDHLFFHQCSSQYSLNSKKFNHAQKDKPSDQLTLGTSKIRILLVDDEEIYRKYLAKQIEDIDINAEIFEASTKEEALRLAEKHKPDLAIVDFDFKSDYTGQTISEEMMRKNIASAIYINSNHMQESLSISTNGLNFISKPIDNLTLISLIKKVYPTQQGV